MFSEHKKTLKATLLIALSAILYGFLGYLGTNILRENMGISTMLFWRFFIAGCFLLLFAIKKQLGSEVTNLVDQRVLLLMFFGGAICYAAASGCYFLASQYTGTGIAMVLLFSYPIIIALFSWLIHGQKINSAIVLTLVAMMLGFFLLDNTSVKTLSMLGILFGVMSAIFYACYVIGSKQCSTAMLDSSMLSMALCFGCAFIFLICALSVHAFVFPSSIKNVMYLLAIGILATALPVQLMLEGLKCVSSMRASIISVLEPLMTVLVGVALLHESISHLQLFGAVIILGGALLIQLQKEL